MNGEPKPANPEMYRIVYAPEADAQLIQLYRYIAQEASPATAQRFTDAIVDQCESLCRFPNRGTPRDDIRPGLRTIAFRPPKSSPGHHRLCGLRRCRDDPRHILWRPGLSDDP